MATINSEHPTTNLELNGLLHELVTSLQTVLVHNFVAAYLQGSLAVGDWDLDSDVDFLVVVEHEITDAELSNLQTMHGRIFDLPSTWAQHLEGSYFPRAILKNNELPRAALQYLDNTRRELIRSTHDNTSIVRWVTREYGIALAGPQSTELVPLITAAELRREILATMRRWAHIIFANPAEMDNRWYQPYAVLSYCRMLHSLHTGRVASKPAGAKWAQTTLEPRWHSLIQRAWAERPNPSLKVRQKADPQDFESTLEFIRYALALTD